MHLPYSSRSSAVRLRTSHACRRRERSSAALSCAGAPKKGPSPGRPSATLMGEMDMRCPRGPKPGVVTAYGGRTTCSAVKALSEGGSAPLREGRGGQGVWGRVGLPLGYSPPQAKLSAC